MTEQEKRDRLRYLQLKSKMASAAGESAPRSPAPKREKTSQLESAGRGLRQGATLGFADEIGARFGNFLDNVTGLNDRTAEMLGTEPATDGYETLRDSYREDEKQARKDNPWSYGLAEAAGSMILPAGAGGSFARTVGRSALEGAAYGAGASEGEGFEEVARDAVGGGLTAGFVSGGLQGVANAGNQIAKRRVAEDLYDPSRGPGMEFKPIHLADEDGVLGKVYRNTVGRVWGADKALRGQQQPFVDAADATVDAAKKRADDMAEKLKRQAEDAIPETKIDRLAQEKIAKIEGEAANKAGRLQRGADTYADADLRQFRRTAIQEAIPSSMPAKAAERIAGMPPRQADAALRQWYKKNGFRMVKDRSFKWEGNVDKGFKNDLRDMLSKDPELALEVGGVVGMIGGMTERLKKAAKSDGGGLAPQDYIDEMLEAQIVEINGDALMAMRNVFGRRANKGSQSFDGASMAKIRDKFDDLITSQMDDAAEDAYRNELGKWGVRVRLSDAVEKARKKGQDFGPKEWISGKGSAPGQTRADELIADASTEGQAVLKKALKGIDKDAKLATRAEKERAGALTKAIKKGRKRRTRRLTKANQKAVNQAQEARGELSEIPKDPTGLSTMLTTGMLGSATGMGALAAGMGAAPAAAVALPAGIGAGRLLATQGAQKALAGQSRLQRGMQRLGDDERARLIARLMREGMSREAAMLNAGG